MGRAVFGLALSDAQRGEFLWIRDVGDLSRQSLMRAEERVTAGARVVRSGLSAVKLASREGVVMPESKEYPYRPTMVGTGMVGLDVEGWTGMAAATAGPSRPRGWAALVARVGEEGAAFLEKGEPFTVPSRRWPGVLFQVKKDGSVSAVHVVREDGQPADVKDVAEVPAPTYPGNGGPPPWPEAVLGRLMALAVDETLLFGAGELGGVAPVTRRMRLGDERGE